MDYITAAKIRHYSKNRASEISKLVKEKLDSNICFIAPEFLCIFYDTLTKEPCCYWNNAVYRQTYSQLDTLFKENSTPIFFYDELIEHFLIGYHTYQQITNIINDLEKLNDSHEIKNRLYRIPTYISIVEGCLTNLFRFILLVLDQTSSKDFSSQKKLAPICEALQRNGFDLLVKDVNVNIRNAINHGGVIFKENGKVIEFLYNENRQLMVLSVNAYEIDQLINKVYDVAGGVLLGISQFLNEHITSITVDRTGEFFAPFCLLGMELSIPSIRCKSISGLPENKQINLDFYIENTDRAFLFQTAIELVILVYSKYSDYKQYMVSFSNERLQSSWIRFTNQDVFDMINKKREFSDVVTDIIQRKDCLIWNVSTEEIDLQEVKYFRFPNYSCSNFKINRVEDASLPDKKRIRAHLFIGHITDKKEILEIIQQSISWLKNVKNPPSPTLPHKYGTMEADSLYIKVYREDSRKNKEMYPNNKNFVCFVDYNLNGETTLENGGVFESLWRQFYHEKIGNIQIAWREGKYDIVRKAVSVGRNDICPCGSGKKYKKCCIKKEV
ncbi:MAG: SEC-C metal-binding domain-containing protein [Lacrimispora sp.]|uniref:SEC-C metal-binding domain-containing protein n=1 Tax=Lacrimispora sp. TaxID=2719234 RepID=UPI0039E68C02